MNERRDLELERQELLRQIEAALPNNMREPAQASGQPHPIPNVILSTNEVGTAYADQR